jgi:heptosyltransferase-3
VSALARLGRTLLEVAVRWVYRPGPPADPDPARIHKVLVVRPDPRVGNVLLTTPLLRALKAGLPGARVEMLVARGKEPLVQGLPFIDGLVSFDKQSFFRSPLRFWRFVRGLRAAGYDLAIEAGHFHAFSFTAAWLTRATGARIRIGHDRGLAARFLTDAVAHDPAQVNDVRAKLELLLPLHLLPAGTELQTPLGGALPAGIPTAPFVALNLGARKADHRWPPEAFGALARRLQARGLVPLLLWGPGEEALCEAALAASGGLAVRGPPTNLEELAATFRACAVAVTNDTGPMHLACAVGAKVVAVFLADDAERWAHPGPRFAGVRVRDEADAVEAVERAVLQLL